MYKINVKYNLIIFKFIGQDSPENPIHPHDFCDRFHMEDKRQISEEDMLDVLT